MKVANFKLKEPIVFGSETIHEVVIQQPKAKHLRGMNLQDIKFDDFLELISKLSGMPPSQVDELSMADLMPMIEVVVDFLEVSPETGQNP